MFQLQNENNVIQFEIPDLNKMFTIQLDNNVNGEELKKEMIQLYNSKFYDLEFWYQNILLDSGKPLIQQGVNSSGKITIVLVAPIILRVDELNKKYLIKLTSKMKTIDLQNFLQEQNGYNLIFSFSKYEQILSPNETLFNQNVIKNDELAVKKLRQGGQ